MADSTPPDRDAPGSVAPPPLADEAEDRPSPVPVAKPGERFASPRERRERRKDEAGRRTRRGSVDAWLERLMFVVVLGSVLAVGTVHVPTLLVVGTFGIAAGVVALLLYRHDMGTWPITLPAAGVFALTVWTAVQAVPLPAWLVAKIAPNNAFVWAHVLDPLGEAGPAWHAISLDPGATWVEALKGMTYLGMILASTVIAYRRGAVFGVAAVFASALAAGLTTIAHGLAGMTKVFGIYEPVHGFAAWHIGPLLNANHLAGYLNLGAMCGLGVLLMRKTRIPRWFSGLGVATLFAISISSASRGAVVLLPLGVAIVVLLLRGRSASRAGGSVSRRWLNILTLTAVGGGLALAALGLTTKQWDELVSEDLSKLSILTWAKPMVADHAWLGVGRGAFETVYPAYRPGVGHVLWTNPENLLVQWAAEWGIPVAALAAVFFVWLIRPTRMGATRSGVAAGAVGGIIVLVLQNWVDFSLELPSVGIAVVVLVGSCWGDTARRGVQKWDRETSFFRRWVVRLGGKSEHEHEGKRRGADRFAMFRGKWVAVLFATAGVGAIVMAGLAGRPTPLADRLAFHELIQGPPMPKAMFDPLIRAAMLRHPGEPYLPLVGAERAWRQRDDNPVPYLQRVFARAKTYGRAHLLLAEILFSRRAQNQALMELKFACRDEIGLTGAAVALAVAHAKHDEQLARMVPDGPEGAAVLDTLGAWMRGREPELGNRFDELALKRDPSLIAPRLRQASDIVGTLAKRDAQGCSTEKERRACADRVEEHAKRIEQSAPDTSTAAVLRANALVALGRPEDAAKLLANTCEHVKDRFECLRTRVGIEANLKGHEKTVEELLTQIGSSGCAGSRACAATHLWIGSFSEGRGNLGGAANAYRKATMHEPQNADAWIRLGNVSSQLGTHAQAADAYDHALKLRPDDNALRAQRDAAREKMLGSLIRR